jgi:predicted transcriptional regulator
MILISLNLQVMVILRDFQEIIAEILECAQVGQGITKTRVMYEVQLSFKQIKEYLQYLQQCKLLSYDDEKRVFSTTIKGKMFLKLYNEMTELTSGRISEKFKTK